MPSRSRRSWSAWRRTLRANADVVVAVGESGLDFFRTGEKGRPPSREAFRRTHRPGQGARPAPADPRPRRAHRLRGGAGGRRRPERTDSTASQAEPSWPPPAPSTAGTPPSPVRSPTRPTPPSREAVAALPTTSSWWRPTHPTFLPGAGAAGPTPPTSWVTRSASWPSSGGWGRSRSAAVCRPPPRRSTGRGDHRRNRPLTSCGCGLRAHGPGKEMVPGPA